MTDLNIQESQETYSYLAALNDMYVNGGIEKMTKMGLNDYVKECCPYMPKPLQALLSGMDIGGQLSDEQLTMLLLEAKKQMLNNPITW